MPCPTESPYDERKKEKLINSAPWKPYLREIVAEAHKWCGTDFWDLASLDPQWNTPPWDIKNGISEFFSCTVGG